MRIYASLAKIVAIASLLTTALVGRNATASDFLDVSGMKAIYDAETGSLRFEGLFNIHGVGIGRNDKASFRPEGAATTQASFSVANEEEAGWLFLDGIEGGTFDAGAIFPAGLSDGLSNFYIGVSSIGSGKNVTPIPIYTPSGAYLPNFDLYAPPPIMETPPVLDPVVPVIPIEPVIIPVAPTIPTDPVVPANDFLDVSGMKAIYDAETGSLRFEGLFNIHGVGIGRTDKVDFRPEGAAMTDASFAVTNEEEAGWLFFDGIERGSFDAGTIFPTGLSDELSDFYIGVSSIGSGKNVTPIPIYSSSGVYLPNFDLFAPSMPIVETPPIQEPVVPAVPGEPVLPVEPVVELPPPADPPAPENDPVVAPEIDPVVVPPVVNVDDLEPPPDEGVPTIIDIVSQPGNRIEIWRPTDEWRFTYELTWEETQTFVDWGGRLLSYVDLDGVDYDGIVELTGLSADLTQFTSLLLTTSVNSTSLSTGRLMGAMSFAGRSDVQVAVPEPSVGVLLLGAIVGLKAARRQFKR